jgi:hypothetical protein
VKSIVRGQSESERCRETRVCAWCEAGACEETVVKGGDALEAGGGCRIGWLRTAFDQTGGVIDADAPEKSAGRFVGVVAEEIVERGAAQAGCRRDGGDIREVGGGVADARGGLFVEVLVPFLAAVEPVGVTAAAGA